MDVGIKDMHRVGVTEGEMEDDHSAEEEEALTDIIQIQVFKKHKHVSYLVF